MIPEFTAIDKTPILGQELTACIKPMGAKIFWDGKKLAKKPKVEIHVIDKLLSDIYTNAIEHFNSSVQYGYYVYNYETDKVISGKDIDTPNFICLKSKRKLMDTTFMKTMKMNHVNSILTDVGMLEHKKIISCIIFKQGTTPIFKYVVKKNQAVDIPSYLVKMLSYKFFNSMTDAINTFADRSDALLSIANQIFINKLNDDLSISSKMVFDQSIKIKSIPAKLDLIGNDKVREIIRGNHNLYYTYISLIHMLSNKKYDDHIHDQTVKANITEYRNRIHNKRILLAFKEYNLCRELIKI